MTKAEFAEYLRGKGYSAEVEDSVVMVLNVPFKRISREAKKAGYRESYGVRNEKEEPFETISLQGASNV